MITESDDSCSSNPCKNNARCEQLETGYKCVCVYGYSGEMCETGKISLPLSPSFLFVCPYKNIGFVGCTLIRFMHFIVYSDHFELLTFFVHLRDS